MESVTVQPAAREPVVFGHALETLLAAAGPLSPSTLAALERLGVSALRPLHAAYPYSVWPGAIRLLADSEETEYGLGQRFIEHARNSKLGAAMDDRARAMGAERMLLRMTHNLRSSNNVLEAAVTPRSEDTGWELRVHPVAEFVRAPGLRAEPPHFVRGLLTAAFQRAGALTARVEVLEHDAVRVTTTFHVML